MRHTGFPDTRDAIVAMGPSEDGASSRRMQRMERWRVTHAEVGTFAPLVAWLVGSAAALAAAALSDATALPAGAGAAGLLLAALVLRLDVRSAALAAGALAPAALGTDEPVAWLAAGGLVAVAVARCARVVAITMNDLERHLMWCRRREDLADLVVARIEDRDLRDPAGLVASFRITDSVALRRRDGAYELTALLDHHELDRAGVERRIEHICGRQLDWGWALFPRDGVTLDVLVERARRAPGATVAPVSEREAAHAMTRSVA